MHIAASSRCASAFVSNKRLPHVLDSLILPMLAQDFHEPLYLTDVPVQIEDTRSAEEQKYPELFRHKLQGMKRYIIMCCLHNCSACQVVLADE